MRLIDYYNDMNDEQKAEFYKQAIIPKDVSLEIESFEDFYNKRKEILAAKIRELLRPCLKKDRDWIKATK